MWWMGNTNTSFLKTKHCHMPMWIILSTLLSLYKYSAKSQKVPYYEIDLPPKSSYEPLLKIIQTF